MDAECIEWVVNLEVQHRFGGHNLEEAPDDSDQQRNLHTLGVAARSAGDQARQDPVAEGRHRLHFVDPHAH